MLYLFNLYATHPTWRQLRVASLPQKIRELCVVGRSPRILWAQPSAMCWKTTPLPSPQCWIDLKSVVVFLKCFPSSKLGPQWHIQGRRLCYHCECEYAHALTQRGGGDHTNSSRAMRNNYKQLATKGTLLFLHFGQLPPCAVPRWPAVTRLLGESKVETVPSREAASRSSSWEEWPDAYQAALGLTIMKTPIA